MLSIKLSAANIKKLSASAPNYFGNHHMTSQGWNYPPPTGQETMEREFTADFSTQLPYHPAPENVFRLNNHSDSSSDADSSMTSNNSTNEWNPGLKPKTLNNNISSDAITAKKNAEVNSVLKLENFHIL